MTQATVVYCVLPRDLAHKLHEPLRRHFRDDPSVEVIVEHRRTDRRQSPERRTTAADEPPPVEQRRIRNRTGRRVGDRRVAAVQVDPLPLPRRARPHAERLTFVERLEPADQESEDLDTARLVTRIQAGDDDAFAVLYSRYFDRVYSYLRLVLTTPENAEDAAQQVFTRVLEALPRYERRERRPFRGWLFVVVRNHALDELRRTSRVELMAPDELSRRRSHEEADDDPASALDWITDRDLLLFVERLPLAQRQVLAMRYILDLTFVEIAAALDRSHDDVRGLHHRALRFLEARLRALGRTPRQAQREVRARTRPRQARVLRMRRFSLNS